MPVGGMFVHSPQAWSNVRDTDSDLRLKTRSNAILKPHAQPLEVIPKALPLRYLLRNKSSAVKGAYRNMAMPTFSGSVGLN